MKSGTTFTEQVGAKQPEGLQTGRGELVVPLPLANRWLPYLEQTGDGSGAAELLNDLGCVHNPILGVPKAERNRHAYDFYEYASQMLKDRLRSAMDGPPRVSQVSLAKACGVSGPTVNDWLSGKTKTIKGAFLLAAARHLGVSADWLATGRGAMRPSPETHAESEATAAKRSQGSGRKSHPQRIDPAILLEAGETLDLLETTEGRPSLLPTEDLKEWLLKLSDMYGTVAEAGGSIPSRQLQDMMRAAIKRREQAEEADEQGTRHRGIRARTGRGK